MRLVVKEILRVKLKRDKLLFLFLLFLSLLKHKDLAREKTNYSGDN